MLSVIVYINPNIIDNLGDAGKIIVNPILLGWKLRRVNYTLTLLNALIVKVTTKLTLIFISLGSIDLIMNNI